MARVIVSPAAIAGLERCRSFLVTRDAAAARRAAEAIQTRFRRLEDHPLIGRPHADAPELRELAIPFGESGYVALYRFIEDENLVVVLAFRHQREAGY